MEWYCNDLSLQGQFATPQDFANSLREILRLRLNHPDLAQNLFVSRTLVYQKAVGDQPVYRIVTGLSDRNLLSQIMLWIGNRGGPFWDDQPNENLDDYFIFCGQDVTSQGLGEAARRYLSDIDARTFSFPGSKNPFCDKSELTVQQVLSEQLIQSVNVPNVWHWDSLIEEIPVALPHSWDEMVTQFQQSFPYLILADTIQTQLAPHPFSGYAAKQFYQLLSILNKICLETNEETGELTKTGMELWLKSTTGDRAKISDESDTNRSRFRQEMTFPDPSNTSNQLLFCSWHGKVNNPQPFRIHFQWPRPPGQKMIKIVYIGVKITKK